MTTFPSGPLSEALARKREECKLPRRKSYWDELDRLLADYLVLYAPCFTDLHSRVPVHKIRPDEDGPADCGFSTTHIPFTHEEFDYDPSAPHATEAVEAFRRLAEKLEGVLVGTLESPNPLGVPTYGALNAPGAVKIQCDPGESAAEWLLRCAKAPLYERMHFGPYAVWHGPAWGDFFKCDIMRAPINGAFGFSHAVETPAIKDRSVAVVQYTPNVIRLAEVLHPQCLPWSQGDKDNHCAALCCVAPQIRQAFDNNTGIAVRRRKP